MDFDVAVMKHNQWKVTLRNAISERLELDVSTISKDNCCDLGKWLHGEAKPKFGLLSDYVFCVSKHAAFHVEAGKVAQIINAKKFEEAEKMLNSGTPYATASVEAEKAIKQLKKSTANM
jgi:methyl-accepting chemotaxis protein